MNDYLGSDGARRGHRAPHHSVALQPSPPLQRILGPIRDFVKVLIRWKGMNRPADDPRLTRDFLIDTDTASDDAVALIMALRNPGVHVRAITTVAGNVPVEQATRNAL